MHNTEILIIIALLLLALGIVCMVIKDKTIIDKFTVDDNIKSEMSKQIAMLDKLSEYSETDIKNASGNFMPHKQILQNYKSSMNNLLVPIQESSTGDIKNKEQQIQEMNKYVDSLNEYAQRDVLNKLNAKDINTLKSHNNGMEISVNKSDTGLRNYMVKINNGCLSVPSDNNYAVTACNSGDPDQIFNLNYVFNETGYRGLMDPAFPQLASLGNVRYPFGMLRAKSNGNCLKNFHGYVTVEPCREYEGQRWAPVESVNKC